MTEQQYRVIADRDKGDDPTIDDIAFGDRATFGDYFKSGYPVVVRIERPVPTTDEPKKPELVTLHLYRDTCVGGLFISERALDRTLHEHVEALTIRRDRLPVPSLPTRKQIAETLWTLDMNLPWTTNPQWQAQYLERADAVHALLQKEADR